MNVLLKCVITAVGLIGLNRVTGTTEMCRKRVTTIVRKRHPSYQITDLLLLFADWSSTVRPVYGDHRPTSATATINNGHEQRTLHLSKSFGIWRITHDAPDFGENVPDSEYFMEDEYAAVGKRIDISSCVSNAWVIPDKNGNLYHKSGDDDNWYYSYHYIRNIYRTQNGCVYVLNRETFAWNLTALKYSDVDFYGNYTRIPKEQAESIISEHHPKA